LGPDNISQAIKALKPHKPYALDASSLLEKNAGIKDHKKIKRFIQYAKAL
jgi:phosphoribosylanthranilate isomerase